MKDIEVNTSWVKPLVFKVLAYMFMFLLGAVITALTLDNRGSAMIRAFTYPQVVNDAEFVKVMEVSSK